MKNMKTKLTTLLLIGSFAAFAQAPSWQWLKKGGSVESDMAQTSCTDPSGNLYVAGTYEDAAITFGNTTLNNTGRKDAFLVKYDPTGNVQWARSIGSKKGMDEDIRSIVCDNAGNVYFCSDPPGTDSILVHNTVVKNYPVTWNVMLGKFDAAGNLQWARIIGENAPWPHDIAIDAAGNLYITGHYFNTTKFGSYSLTSAGERDIFLVKCDNSGAVQWAKSAGGTEFESVTALAVDAAGNSYVSAYFDSPTIVFGSSTLTFSDTPGRPDALLLKFSSTGSPVWARQGVKVSSGIKRTVDVCVSGSNIYLLGHSASIKFGSYTLTSLGSSDIFLVRYDANGNVTMARSYGGTSIEEAVALTADAAGNMYILGDQNSATVAYGSFTLAKQGASYGDPVIIKTDAAGTCQWATSLSGTLGNLEPDNLVLGSSGTYYVTGSYACDTLFAGTHQLQTTTQYYYDVFVAKLGPVTTGEGEIALNNLSFDVYPNPASGEVRISTAEEGASIRIFGINGAMVHERTANGNELVIDLSGQAPGLYFVEIRKGAERTIKKLIVQ